VTNDYRFELGFVSNQAFHHFQASGNVYQRWNFQIYKLK
jgi:hypothetical protein